MAAYTPDMAIDEMIRLRYEELQPMTQAEAGLACGVGQSSFNRWLRGRSAPRPEHVDAVARFLGTDTAMVLNGVQLQRLRGRLGDPAEAIRYLTEQLIKYQEFVPEDRRKEADEVIAEIVQWLPVALEDAAGSRFGPAQEQFALAADTGNEPGDAKAPKRRPRPPEEPEGT